jgi:hypothetical protein
VADGRLEQLQRDLQELISLISGDPSMPERIFRPWILSVIENIQIRLIRLELGDAAISEAPTKPDMRRPTPPPWKNDKVLEQLEKGKK